MRLLSFTNLGELSVAEFVDDNVPSYAVLSHTWGPKDEEVTLQDLQENAGKSKFGSLGYKKIQFCGKQAAFHGISHFWVDTCCIDKSSSAELSEAINSMFKWYRNAARCFVYLSDVSTNGYNNNSDSSQSNIEAAFRKSRWFTRGWTLQELIAPSSVEFFSQKCKLIGDKTSLERQIHEITEIPVKVIQGSSLSQFTVEERMSWAAKRTTTRKEDEAYCLLGIFGVFMPLLYGEGKENAFIRLQEAIDKPLSKPFSLKQCLFRKVITLKSNKLRPLTGGSETESPLSHLPYAVDAPFNAYSRQHDPTCLSDTRIDLLHEIYTWADGKDGRLIYWLNGLAGTGKSTIARTVARKYFETGQLGASFFFSRGGGDVGHASKFFTTIAVQLAKKSQSLRRHICDAFKKNSDIATQSLGDQWRQLVLGPLTMSSRDLCLSSCILVVDALDECDNEDDIPTILKLLAEAQTLQTVRLRVLLTSRPEIPIRHGFYQIPATEHQDFVLHHISPSIVDHDIKIFLEYKLRLIGQERSLDLGWPGEGVIRCLVQNAGGLFIWVATACRFIQEGKRFADKRLAMIYENSSNAITAPEKHLNEIYLTVLKHSVSAKYSNEEKEELYGMMRYILGSAVVLLSPLSPYSLSKLLHVSKRDLDQTLDDLHAILEVAKDQTRPLRLHHPSFRDFLLDKNRCNDPNFSVDEKEAHQKLAGSCIQLMSASLKEDICGVTIPGTLVADVNSCQVKQYLPLEVQYACLHWVKHLRRSDVQLQDHDYIHQFLQKHLLHWLEALCWMRKISEGILAIISLESMASVVRCFILYGLIYDVKRFALHNRAGIEQAPLQIYHSALFFTPATSILRREYRSNVPFWIRRGPEVEADWSSTLQILEGHSDLVHDVAFSSDGKQLASGSRDSIVRIWDVATGATLQTLKGHSNAVKAVVFSPNGRQLVSGSCDKTVRIWDMATGATLQTLEGHSDLINTVAFSLDGKQLASGSYDKTVRTWDAVTGATLRTFKGHSFMVCTVAFSPDSKQLASGSMDTTVRIWDLATGATLRTLKGHSYRVNDVAFSPDGKQLASGSSDKAIRIWDAVTGAILRTLQGHSFTVSTVAFSPDSKQLASGLKDTTVRIWDLATGAILQTLEGHSGSVSAVAFSPNGKQLASGSDDKTVRIWDAAVGATSQNLKDYPPTVDAVAFSPDGKQVASGSRDGTVRIWSAATGATLRTLEGHSSTVNGVAFSPDGKLLVSESGDKTLRIWDAATGATLQTLEGHSDLINTVAFSPDNKQLASGSKDQTVRIWEVATGAALQTLKGHSSWVKDVAFSPDGKQLGSGSNDQTVRIWDVATGATLQTLVGNFTWLDPNHVNAIAFSFDGKQLASGSEDATARIWDVATGATLQILEGHSSSVKDVAFSPDGKQVASGSHDNTIRIWDVATGATLQALEANTVITRLSYYIDGSIVTNRGRLDAISLDDNAALSSIPSPLLSRPVAYQPNLFVQDEWIVHGENRLLWLPPDYRHPCSTVHENIVCLVHCSGRLSIFELSFSFWKELRARTFETHRFPLLNH